MELELELEFIAWTLGIFASRWDIWRTVHPLVRGNTGSAVPILQVRSPAQRALPLYWRQCNASIWVQCQMASLDLRKLGLQNYVQMNQTMLLKVVGVSE